MKSLTLTAVVLLVLQASGLMANDSWWGDVYKERAVTLEQILKTPHAFRGVDVTFVVQFQSLGSIDNPYYTRFEKQQYVNFACWSDQAQLWDRKVYDDSFPYLFIDRFMKESKEIVKAQAYDRFLITGRVESVFRGKPWIEVVGLKALDGRMTEPSLIRLVKAYKLKKHRRFDAAAAEFELSHHKELPGHVQKHIFHEQGRCLVAVDRFESALVPLNKALAFNEKDVALVKMVKLCQDKVVLVKKKKEKAAAESGKSKPAKKPMRRGKPLPRGNPTKRP